MTLAIGQVLLLIAAAAAVVWALRALAWGLLQALIAAVERWPRFRGTGAWARVRPVQAWLRLRYPRLCAVLGARLTPQSFTGLPLTLLVFAAAYIAALLGGLAEEVVEAAGVTRFDQAINAFFGPWREPSLVGGFLWITALGAGPALTAVAVTATGFLWADRRPGFILPLWVAFLGAQATTWAGKYAIARHRPPFIEVVSAASPSFPSGHATASMALYGFVAYALIRDLPGRPARFEVAFWTALLIATIGFSRIFLSLHYMTDVIAGFMVGGFWLLVGFALTEWQRGGRGNA
jgi:undecaprenyl-diphosphatase